MNTLFFDVYDDKTKVLTKDIFSKLCNKIFNFNMYFDILNDGILKDNISLIIYDNKEDKKESLLGKISKYVIAKKLYKKLSKCYRVNIVISEKVSDYNFKYLMQILDLVIKFDKNVNTTIEKFKIIEKKNNMHINDVKYIDDYISEKNIDIAKLKILVLIGNIEDLNITQIEKYIQNYKFVDIILLNSVSKHLVNKVNNIITKLNNDYGTTIEVIQKRNLTSYSIYLNYSNISKQDIISSYILSPYSKFINMYDADEDYENINNKSYYNYCDMLEPLFLRLNIDIEKFSKNRLGALIVNEYNILDK